MINKRNIKEFFIISVGTLIVSTAVYFFMLPSHVSVGSGTALAMVMDWLVRISFLLPRVLSGKWKKLCGLA